ncbi:MAG TPA: archaeosortase/exosortase family protein, partial [Terriglobales bacterium]|nr:archaeosortase/exosortase family protein [Terriglobales bacterium]
MYQQVEQRIPEAPTAIGIPISDASVLSRYLLAGLLSAAILLLYFPVLSYLVKQWYTDPNYSHGFLVLPFSAYLVWRDRKRLRNVESRPTWAGLVLILFSLGLLFVGQIGADLFLSRISLIGVIAGSLLFLHGKPL